MIDLTFAVPYSSLEKVVYQVLEEHPLNSQIKRNVFTLDVKDAKSLNFPSDAIIARGAAASILKKSENRIPVIEIPITGYDLIQAVYKCRDLYKAKKIAYIGSVDALYCIGCIQKAIQAEILCFETEGAEEEKRRFVHKAIRSGAEALIGGRIVATIAQEMAFPVVMIESGVESIRRSLDEAIRVSTITRAERARSERFRTIMDYSYEGIIAVDEKGEITLLNKTARDILAAGENDLLGRNINLALPEMGLGQVLQSGKEELEGLHTIRETTVSANQVPLIIGAEIVGAVTTFQRISRIQEIEEKIRKKMYKKGLTAKYTFKDIVGSSPAINDAIALAMKYSEADSNILLLGETGTGKELFAQSIHNASRRKLGPFIAVNCAAIPESLLESELFGYVEGAFTGASKAGKTGLFELAHKGSIFLDEISELSLPFQARLLRVLQEKEIMRLGDDRVIPVDVRVIAASNKSLKAQVQEGQFRKDLLYRIDVLRIAIPPLRQRKEDIPKLLEHYMRVNNRQFGKALRTFRHEALRVLVDYDWPGNIRELVNICERLSIIAEGEEVDFASVTKVMDNDGDEKPEKPLEPDKPDAAIDHKSFENGEREIILAALRKTTYNKRRTADLLGIDNSTLWRKMKKYGIQV